MSLPPEGTGSASWRSALVLVGVGLLVGLLSGVAIFVGLPEFSVRAPGQTGQTGTPAPAPVVGAPAPDFGLTNLDGQDVRLSDLRGRVVLINFWATWCGPCRIEMPHFEKKHQALESQGLTVLAVNLDEAASDVSAFADELSLTFPILLDPGGAVNTLYRVRGYPTTFFVNRDGMIDRQHIGLMTEGQLDDYLARLGLIE
jgi:cytochrome c biogenesis protein CcmG, thiol:disulfide interchange protein DsbE